MPQYLSFYPAQQIVI